MTKFKFLLQSLVICFIFITSTAKADEAALSSYVNKLLTQFVDITKDASLSNDAKAQKIRGMLLKNLDFDWMGKFTLGRHRRNMSQGDVSSFTGVYRDYLTKTYSEAVRNYKGEKIIVKSAQKISDNEYVVKTLISKTNQGALAVDYLVRQFGNGAQASYKVFDIVTEGVSMINSQQSEFGSILASGGLDRLKTELAAKTLSNSNPS